MASVLILSEHGNGIPIALRLADENHIVKLWIKNGKKKRLLETIKNLNQISNPKAMLDQYDLVLCDSSRLGLLCDELVEKKKMVIGGGSFSDKLTLDEKYQMQVVKTLLKTVKDQIEGVNIAIEGWFNGQEFTRPFSHLITFEPLLSGNIGPLTKGMGLVVWLTNGNRLTAEVLEPLQPLLEKVAYLGSISIYCVVNEEKIYISNFKLTLNCDTLQALCELLQLPLFDYLYGIATQKKQEFPFHNEYAINIKLTVPPYPYEGELMDLQLSIVEEAKKHVWLSESDNTIGFVTARGVSVRECQRRAYRTIKNILMPKEVQYRNDIGQGVEEFKEKLTGWGWL